MQDAKKKRSGTCDRCRMVSPSLLMMTQPTLYEPNEPALGRLLTVAELCRNKKLPLLSCNGGGPLSTSSL